MTTLSYEPHPADHTPAVSSPAWFIRERPQRFWDHLLLRSKRYDVRCYTPNCMVVLGPLDEGAAHGVVSMYMVAQQVRMTTL